MTDAEVRLWGRTIGAVSWDDASRMAYFEYDRDFRESGIEIAPLTMPLSDRVFSFPALPRSTFKGLPGLLADSLPDDYGNAVIDAWLAAEGRLNAPLNAVERLCYTGVRGMGALEYHPRQGPAATHSERLDVAALVDLAGRILAHRNKVDGSFAPTKAEDTLRTILRVGTSAGGARAKAIITWNPDTEEVRSGQTDAGPGFTHWILKFDGVSDSRLGELDTGRSYGRIELAYHLMAVAAGVDMMPSRLFHENGRSHFMTRRFDRTDTGRKIHMQTLGAMAHLDYRQAGAHAYEQALRTIRKLDMPMDALEEQYLRMVFNVVARNQDDHVKNIAFLMDRRGVWSLSPAYDMTYSYNPGGEWTAEHQMSINGKCDGFELEDLLACARTVSIRTSRAREIVARVTEAVGRWEEFAGETSVPGRDVTRIARTHRLGLLG